MSDNWIVCGSTLTLPNRRTGEGWRFLDSAT